MSNSRITDIAFKYGYDTSEAFTKAFQRYHGITPSAAREPGTKLKSFSPLLIQISLRGGDVMDFRLEEKESFAVVGIGKKFTGKTGAHLTQAEKFWTKDLEKSTEEMLISLANGNPDRFGVCSDFDDEGFKYSITVECDSEYPDCFERIVIPKNLWAIFTIKGRYAPVLQEVWDRIFSEWFPTSEYEHVEGPEIDLYHTSTDKEQRYSEVWIPVRKKK